MNRDISVVELTQKLIAFNTVNPPGQEQACIEFIGDILDSSGFEIHVDQFDTFRSNLVASLPGCGSKGHILFSGHIDTVPIGKEPWEKDPFAGEIEKDRLYGRGSTDMKGGIASMIVAAIGYKKKVPGAKGLTLVISGGEETGCIGTLHLMKNTSIFEKIGAMIVSEPTSNQPIIAHKGALWLTMTVHGKSAHGSTPEQGISAIYKAAKIIQSLEHFNFNHPPHALLGRPSLNVGTIQGGMNINSVPDLTTIGIDIRTTPELKSQNILNALAEIAGKETDITVTIDQPSVVTDPTHPWIRSVLSILESHTGKKSIPGSVNYFTDASALSCGLNHPPTLILGPGEVSMPHKKDEYILISNMRAAVNIYTDLISEWMTP